MFTGIIEGMGTVTALRAHAGGRRLTIEADFSLEGVKIGDSISVSGACLTVARLENRRFMADVSPETQAKTTLGLATTGRRVNLERALRVGDRLDGHLVTGHVDGTATVLEKKIRGNTLLIAFKVPPALARYMIQKGSVAVDGVSLTINHCDRGSFRVSIIPHTADITTIGSYRSGDAVNIETDMIGKYVERFVDLRNGGRNRRPSNGSVDMQFLSDTGFL